VESAETPNVLVVFADQMHRFAMRCMDNPDVDTPHLDGLAEQGALFRHAYSSTPVCSPFRVNLVSGRYGMETGAKGNQCLLPEWCRSLVDDFNDSGYRTSFVGKWHVGATGNQPIPEEWRAGFQEFIGYQCYNGFYKDVCFYDEAGTERRFEKHRTDATVDVAIERLRRVASDPFLMIVGFQAPHYPEQPGPEFDRMYRGRDVTPRPNYTGIDLYIPTHSPKSPRPFERCPDFRRYGNDIHEYLRMYYGMVTQIDANVGRLLSELEDLGIADDTIVLFASDHGDLAGSHGMNGKCVSYEESAGIPLLMRGPGVPQGMVIDAPIDSSSFLPTCMELAGVPASQADTASRSRAALLRGEPDDRPAFADLRNWCMVRQGDFKLTIEDDDCHPAMLFNVADDPYEQQNLIEDPAHADTLAELLQVVTQWRQGCLGFRQAGEAG
jgi:arylsulfatase A-like enzyme